MSGLIKNIFFPEKFDSYYLFSKKIVGLDIGKTSVRATKVTVRARQHYVDQYVEEVIAGNGAETYNEHAAQAVKLALTKLGKYDEVHIALSSAVVIFKELTIPFLTRDKISMVVNFEVESLLPFPLHEAIIDFIITNQDIKQNKSDILVAAVQKQYIAQQLSIVETAGVLAPVVTVDIFAVYGLYKQIPSYVQSEGATILIDLGLNSSRVALIINSQLKMIRTIAKGVSYLAKKGAQELNTNPQEVMADIIRFGLEKDNPEYKQAIEKAINSFWRDIDLTLTSFTTHFLERKTISKIIFLGGGAEIKGFKSFITQKTTVPIELFDTDALNKNKSIHFKNNIPLSHVISLSAALQTNLTINFNLRKQEFAITSQGLLLKQLIAFLILTLTIFTTLITHYSMQTSKLARELGASESEALRALQEIFPSVAQEKRISDAIESATVEITAQKETWFAFSTQARSSFLQYLLELTSKIDKQSLDLQVESITIAEGSLIFKAQVKDYEALKILERELRQSKLFSYVEPQENPRFNMKINLSPTTQEF